MSHRRHAQVRTFARSFVSQHDRAPTRTEIATALGIAPNGHLSRIVNGLRLRGEIAPRVAGAIDRAVAAMNDQPGETIAISRADLETILDAIPERSLK